MLIQRLKSKIHRVTVTEANLNYVGSITIDEEKKTAAVYLKPETDVSPGPKGSGAICLNGAAARTAAVGDVVIIISYGLMDIEEARTFRPSVIFPDEKTNRLVR